MKMVFVCTITFGEEEERGKKRLIYFKNQLNIPKTNVSVYEMRRNSNIWI